MRNISCTKFSYIGLALLIAVACIAQGCGNAPGNTFGSGLVDSDGDGFSDDVEINGIPGTDPFDATDNPNNVRDTDGDGCSDYDEINFAGFYDNDPNTLGSEAFNGYWVAKGTLESGQKLVGTTVVAIEARGGQAACVSEGTSEACPNFDWGKPSISRPITLNNGVILIEFTMDFPLCKYDNITAFEGEKLIDVSIIGLEIAGTDGLVFDVVIERRFVFSSITVLETGTLEHFPSDTVNSCN